MVVTVVTWECVSVVMCERWDNMGGCKSGKVGGVVGKWWGEWKHERTVVGRMGVCGECGCTWQRWCGSVRWTWKLF